MKASSPTAPGAEVRPKFSEAFRFWLKLGFISFGGPAGQIAILHDELVERRRWVTEERFLHALNFCMLLPGPEAQQLATYCGWMLHGVRGGVAAGALFVLPAAAILWLLSWTYVRWGTVPWVGAAFSGLQPAVLALVVWAAIRIGTRVLRHAPLWAIAALTFLGLQFGHTPFPVIVIVAGLLGILGGRIGWQGFSKPLPGADASKPRKAPPASSSRGTALAAVLCGVLWWIPVLLAGWTVGREHVLWRQGIFFSQAAVVTFGGAYAVLPYVAQEAVSTHHWLDLHQMLDGLGLAETTPGPLIMVLQFVGFLGAWNHPGNLPPLLAATLGAAITTWVTFLPSFLWIFAGAPYIERWRTEPRLNDALTAITAAVAGVILHLALWTGGKVLVGTHGPNLLNWAIFAVALTGVWKFRWPVPWIVAGAATVGALSQLF